MSLETLGYIGLRTKNLDDWTAYASPFLGMQLVDKSRGTATFRMDDKKQRLVVNEDAGDAPGFFGWEVKDAAALDAYAARLEGHKVAVRPRLPRARRGAQGPRPDRADRPGRQSPGGLPRRRDHVRSVPARPRHLGLPHRTARHGPRRAPLREDRRRAAVLSRRPRLPSHDYFTKPFAAYFFHVNPRHHSVAFIESGKTGIHHLMVETCYLDDVGQGYDLALKKPEMIATTFGRHYNDQVHSFYSWSPSKFMFEYGWGGRTIDTENWQPEIITQGPSLWGHERYWLTSSSATRPASFASATPRRATASRSTSWTATTSPPATSARGGTPPRLRARLAEALHERQRPAPSPFRTRHSGWNGRRAR